MHWLNSKSMASYKTVVTPLLTHWSYRMSCTKPSELFHVENGPRMGHAGRQAFPGPLPGRNSFADFPMMTSSNGNIFRVTGPLCGEFTGHRWIPRTKTNDAEIWCFLWSAPEYGLSKQSWGWCLKTPSRSLWRHCNASNDLLYIDLQSDKSPG